MDSMCVVLCMLVVLGLWLLIVYLNCSKKDDEDDDNEVEHMTGFGVITGLAFNNRDAICYPGNKMGWAGGCFIPHRVIF